MKQDALQPKGKADLDAILGTLSPNELREARRHMVNAVADLMDQINATRLQITAMESAIKHVDTRVAAITGGASR